VSGDQRSKRPRASPLTVVLWFMVAGLAAAVFIQGMLH